MAEFRIRIILDPSGALRGARRIERGLGGIERRALRLTTLLGQALGFVGFAAGIREIARLADTFTNTENRLKLVTNGTKQLNAVMKELFKIANDTRTAFDGTAKIFARTALATKTLGLSQRDTLNFTKSLNQAIVLSGASAQEANAGLIQLSQGLASNTLRGDELRSVLEQLPKVADVIAKSMGITRGELRLFGAEGKISAETVIVAFQEAADELDKAFAETVPTISQSFVVLQTKLIEFIGAADKASGGTSKLSAAIFGLANNLDSFADAAIIAGSALAVGFVRGGVNVAIVAVNALTAAIARNPLGALLIAIVVATTALVRFADRLKITADGVATVSDVLAELFDRTGGLIDFLIEDFKALGTRILGIFKPIARAFKPITDGLAILFKDFEFTFGGIVLQAARTVDAIVNLFVGAVNAIVAVFKTLPLLLENQMIKAVNKLNSVIGGFVNKTIGAFNKLSDAVGLDPIDLIDVPEFTNFFDVSFSDLGKIAQDAFFKEFGNTALADKVKSFFKSVEERAIFQIDLSTAEDAGLDVRPTRTAVDPAAKKAAASFALQLDMLRQERDLLALNNRERGIQNERLGIEKTLRSANVILTEKQSKLLDAAVRQTQGLREQAEALEDINGGQEELIVTQMALNALYAEQRISIEALTNASMGLRQEQAELNFELGSATFIDGFIVGIGNMLEAVRNFQGEAGEIFGSFFEGVNAGFADAITQSLIFGDSFREGIGNAALQALAGLLSGLIKLGLQYALNATFAKTVSAGITAASIAEAAVIGAAFAGPAALVSLATSGANAIPANAGIASAGVAAKLLAVPGFAEGGMVRGAGGPRSDSILANLSNGEFVVNAKSTARFRPQLEAINKPQGFANGGNVGDSSAQQQGSGGSAQGQQQAPTILNVLDPAIVGDFLATPEGEDVIINVMRKNSSRIQNSQR